MLVALHEFVLGLYRPPVFRATPLPPPQTIISLPVQTAVWKNRPLGAPVVLVAVQLSVTGLYLPPLAGNPETPSPPQTIISLPLQTVV